MMRKKNKKKQQCKPSHRRHNFLALLIASGAFAYLYLHFDPTPVSAMPDDAAAEMQNISTDVEIPTLAVSSESADTKGTETSPKNPDNYLSGDTALAFNMMLLEKGIANFEKTPSYTATFYKKERIGGVLLDAQITSLKIRHRPFSVYMKWLKGDKGRELLYVDGQHDGKMLVKVGGVKGRILPPLKLDPTGSLAMKESRYPVTNIGMLNLAKKILDVREQELAKGVGIECRMFDNQKVNRRNCYCFVVEYPDREDSSLYRKSVMFIDKKFSLPIYIQNYTWPEDDSLAGKKLDEATLIENYSYSNIRTNRQLADNDFDRKNKSYSFKR